MPDTFDQAQDTSLDNRENGQLLRWTGTATIVSIGIVLGGYLLGNGLLRAKDAERSVTVRGLAERDVTANLATCFESHRRASH